MNAAGKGAKGRDSWCRTMDSGPAEAPACPLMAVNLIETPRSTVMNGRRAGFTPDFQQPPRSTLPFRRQSHSPYSQSGARPVEAVLSFELSRTAQTVAAESHRSVMPTPGDGQPG
jgi:hypothetical protein